MLAHNAPRTLAMFVVLSFALRHSTQGQTTTTNTDCTLNGNTAICTSTSTDDSAQKARQAEQQREAYETGQKIGSALGRGILAIRDRQKFNGYCKQHAGEPYVRTWPEGRKEEGLCPGTLAVSKETLVDAHNRSFRAEKIVGYAESSGDTFTIHSERASEMRFRMLLADNQRIELYRTVGIKTLVYTNDADQRYVYEIGTGRAITPVGTTTSRTPTQREVYCKEYPRGIFREYDGSSEYCDVRDDPENREPPPLPASK
jgi:hypothetical protein